MSLSKPLTLRHLCHLLNNIPGLFYHRHFVFLTISLVKNTKCYLPKKSSPEWPRNKLLATTWPLSSSKRLQIPNPFSSTLKPTLKCSWPNWESIVAPLGFVHRSLDHYTTVPIANKVRAPQHHHYTTVTFLAPEPCPLLHRGSCSLLLLFYST